MPLSTNRELLTRAKKGGYAVGAFNINNMEILQAIRLCQRSGKVSGHPCGIRGSHQIRWNALYCLHGSNSL